MSNTFSKKITDKEIQLILKYMSSHKKENNNNSIKHFFKTKKYTITIYSNNTLLIQGESYDNILKLIGEQPKQMEVINNKYNIGSDESGNGDFFGGIAVCACYLDDDIFNKISDLNISDSKLLNDEQISIIANSIKKIVPHSIEYLSPKDYNELFNKYKNINTIKTILHAKAISNINMNDKKVIIDQYTTTEKFEEHLKKTNISIDWKYDLEVKAESKYKVVAAASILARHKFVTELNKISNQIGVELPLGSVDSKILPVLEKIKNKIALEYVCKTHFKTINKK